MQKARHHPIVKFFKNSWSIILTAGSLILIVALFVGISGNSSGGGNKAPDSTVNNGATDNDSSTNNGNSGNVITNDVDLFPSQTISSFVENTNDFPGWYLWTFPEVFEIKEGETYYVEWDGVTYICEGISANYEGIPYTIVYLGNGSSFGYPSNDEPFAITYNAEVGVSEVTAFTDSSESHTLRIYQKETITLQLKDLTVTKNGTYTASLGEAYSSVNVNVPSTGVVDFPYELIETFPETEVLFGFDEDNFFPTTPTYVVNPSHVEGTLYNYLGSSGIIVLDGKYYPYYNTARSSPPLLNKNGMYISMSIDNSVGNISMPKVWHPSSNLYLNRITEGDLVNIAKAGSSGEPYLVVDNNILYGTFFCTNKSKIWLSGLLNSVDPELFGYFKGYYLANYTSWKLEDYVISPNETYYVDWNDKIYTCRPSECVLPVPSGVDENNNIIYVDTLCRYIGNGKSVGKEDTGEPFTVIYGYKNFIHIVYYDNSRYNPETYSGGNSCTIYASEDLKHTIQIFKFGDKIDS